MIRTLKEFDINLNESKTKMKSDVERCLRGLNFGKLYLKNGDFDKAIKYVNSYLSVRPNSSDAYKLLAQINESIGDNDSAIINYRKSLDLRKQNSDNYAFVTPAKNQSFSTPFKLDSPLQLSHNNSIDNSFELNTKSVTTVNERKEVTQSQTPTNPGSHSCGICSNQNVLKQIVEQQESLIESNKMILDVIKQNNTNINDIQQQLVIIHESLNTLNDSQNVLKDTLFDYVTQDNEEFGDYDEDYKENPTFESSGNLDSNENQSNDWRNSSLQPESQTNNQKPLSELFKPPADSWNCDVCYVLNNGSVMTCMACETPNPNASQIQPKGFKLNPEPFSFQPQFTSSTTGFKFGEMNANSNNSIFSNNTFTFGNTLTNETLPSFNSNSFLNSTVKPIESNTQIFPSNKKSDDNKDVSFQFGLSRDFNFKFSENIQKEDPFISPKSPKSPTVLNSSLELQNENSSFTEHPEPSNADNIYFQPVVPLPPKIEVKTGEEEEKILHTCRARLFRFCDNEWKERGVGELKILLSPVSKRIRIVMRRDTVLKVCLNQYITHDLKLQLKEDKKSFTWSAIDCSENTPIPDLFLLRLKNPENAQLFIEAFKSAQLLIKGESISVKPKTETLSDESNVQKVSDKSKTEIVSNKTSNEIIPNKQKETVFGKSKIEKIKDRMSAEKVSDEPKKVENVLIKTQTESSSIVSDDDCEVIYVKMPESEELLKKTIELKLPLNFYDYEKLPDCPGCRGCYDEDYMPSPKPMYNSFKQSESLTPQKVNSVQESLFSSAIAASNVCETNWQTNKAKKPLWLVNTPSPIFSNENKDRTLDEDEVLNPDIYFKPLIPLPELVEVKTGEEDEEPIYCQRAKLYRYDPSLKEWKERGIGDFKILKHNHKNRYRMILRREKILKIACNHYITNSMTLKPMNTSETAICWVAIDFTEGKTTEEQFALKLKNKELLQQFIAVFEKCQKDLENNENSFDLNHSADSDGHNDNDEDTDVEEDQEHD